MTLPKVYPPELTADCIRLAAEGLSQKQIGLAVGISKGRVHHVLRQAGVKTKFWNDRQHRREWSVRDQGPRPERPITLPHVPSLEREEVDVSEPKTFEPCPVCCGEQEIDGLFGKAPCWWCQGSEPDDDEERYAYEMGNTD